MSKKEQFSEVQEEAKTSMQTLAQWREEQAKAARAALEAMQARAAEEKRVLSIRDHAMNDCYFEHEEVAAAVHAIDSVVSCVAAAIYAGEDPASSDDVAAAREVASEKISIIRSVFEILCEGAVADSIRRYTVYGGKPMADLLMCGVLLDDDQLRYIAKNYANDSVVISAVQAYISNHPGYVSSDVINMVQTMTPDYVLLRIQCDKVCSALERYAAASTAEDVAAWADSLEKREFVQLDNETN